MVLVYQRLVRDIGVKSLVLHLQDIDDAWVIKGKGSEPCTEPNKFKCDDWMLPACCAQCSLWSFSALFLCRDAASHCIQLTPCLRSAGLSYFGGLLLIVLFSFICDVRWCDSVWSFTKSRCIWSASIKSLEQPVEGGDELLNSHWELLFCILPLCSAMLSEDLLSHWRSGTVAALMDDYSILIAKWNIKIWFLFGKYNWNFRSWTLGTVVDKPNFCHWG